jgi:hypothetical protein
MSQKFTITAQLSDEHWEPFHQFLADRRTTIDRAQKWLADRGYKISRGAVHRYMRLWAEGSPKVGTWPWQDSAGMAEARRRINGHCLRLGEWELMVIAHLAGLLAGKGSRTKRCAQGPRTKGQRASIQGGSERA